MTILHVQVERGDQYLVAQALEEPGVITQGRTYDELITNILDAAELLLGKSDFHIELLIPSTLNSSSKTRSLKSTKKRFVTRQKRVA
jgi:predicted RNase H-like HicB family nuclease